MIEGARALYGLQKFEEAQNWLTSAAAIDPPSKRTAVDDLARVENRLKEEAGNYDFASMLAQAEESDWPEFDRATYVGPIEIRQCEDESIGRGLFLTKDVKAGDLLLCERAFRVVS